MIISTDYLFRELLQFMLSEMQSIVSLKIYQIYSALLWISMEEYRENWRIKNYNLNTLM